MTTKMDRLAVGRAGVSVGRLIGLGSMLGVVWSVPAQAQFGGGLTNPVQTLTNPLQTLTNPPPTLTNPPPTLRSPPATPPAPLRAPVLGNPPPTLDKVAPN